MRHSEEATSTDAAALQPYFRLRAEGRPHQHALSAAILHLVRDGAAADGREARARVLAALRAQGVVPTDREDWIGTAAASAAWRRGTREAIEQLSAECRGMVPREVDGDGKPATDYEMVGGGIVAQYLRAQMPETIARLRREVMRLFADPANPAR